jgi:vancomycin permeability regulator SanA
MSGMDAREPVDDAVSSDPSYLERCLDRMSTWYATPIPLWIASLRYHRRIYNPWSPRLTRKVLRLTYGDWVGEQARLADKLAVRRLVKARVGDDILPRIYTRATSAQALKVRKLPDSFYLKTNHACGHHIAVHDKQQVNWRATKARLGRLAAVDYTAKTGERQYRKIDRQVYAEEFLDLTGPNCMMLRVFCIGGRPEFIQVDTHSERHDPRETLFRTIDWQPAPFVYGVRFPERHIERPHNLDRVVQIAGVLSQGLPFVRVDMYWLAGRIVFSELTLTPSRGTRDVTPASFDKMLGRRLQLPKEDRFMWTRRAAGGLKRAAVRTARRVMEQAQKAEWFWLGLNNMLGLRRPYKRRSVTLATIPAHVTHLIVPGAGVRSRGISKVLRERLDRAAEIARLRPDVVVIVSGDGRPEAFREDRAMSDDLVKQGISCDRIVRDPHGYSTEQTMRRAADSGVKAALVVTNDFHEARSVYLAVCSGIDAFVVRDSTCRSYTDADRPLRYDERRELLAHLKDGLKQQRRRFTR